jgi:hypothetical protein
MDAAVKPCGGYQNIVGTKRTVDRPAQHPPPNYWKSRKKCFFTSFRLTLSPTRAWYLGITIPSDIIGVNHWWSRRCDAYTNTGISTWLVCRIWYSRWLEPVLWNKLGQLANWPTKKCPVPGRRRQHSIQQDSRLWNSFKMDINMCRFSSSGITPQTPIQLGVCRKNVWQWPLAWCYTVENSLPLDGSVEFSPQLQEFRSLQNSVLNLQLFNQFYFRQQIIHSCG